MLRRAALASLVLVGASAALAAAPAVYRCGNTFSQTPCEPAAAPVPVDDARSAAQQREAEQVAQREAALAEQLRRERLARDAQRPGGAVLIAAAAPAAAASEPPRMRARVVRRVKLRRWAAPPAAPTAPGPTPARP